MKKTTYFTLIFLSLNCFAQKKCKFQINESVILENKNLDYFLEKMKSNTFEIQTKKRAIPNHIKKELDCLTEDFSIANPNEKYQDSCFYEKEMPRRKLLFLAKSNDILILTYATGGIGSSTHFLFIKYDSKQILDLWTGIAMGIFTPKSLDEITQYINSERNLNWGLNTNMISL